LKLLAESNALKNRQHCFHHFRGVVSLLMQNQTKHTLSVEPTDTCKFNLKLKKSVYSQPGAEPDIFFWGGPLEGPVLLQGELSMVCVGLSKRDLKNFGGALGGSGKIFGGQ